MKPSEGELKFIKEHQADYEAALTAAHFSVHANTKLVGLDKLRSPMIIKAALLAIGYPKAPRYFFPALSAGYVAPEVQDMLDEAYAAAVDAAKDKINGHPTP